MDMLAILKPLLPYLLQGASGTAAAITIIALYSMQKSRKVYEERLAKLELRVNSLTRIHCAKYPRHTIAFLDGSNGDQLRSVVDMINIEEVED